MGLFSKKPGGTFFGNLLRKGVTAAQVAVGIPPILGQGKNMISATEPHIDASLSQLQQNQQAIQAVYNGTPQTSVSTSGTQLDLGNFIKLPTIQTNNSLDVKTIAMLGGGAFLLALLIKKL